MSRIWHYIIIRHELRWIDKKLFRTNFFISDNSEKEYDSDQKDDMNIIFIKLVFILGKK